MTHARITRAVAIGALVGLVIALAFALAMPTRYVTTTPLSAPSRVQLYGALAQQNQRPHGGHSSVTTAREKSPRTERDALLGLIAGGLLAFALVTTGRRELGGRA